MFSSVKLKPDVFVRVLRGVKPSTITGIKFQGSGGEEDFFDDFIEQLIIGKATIQISGENIILKKRGGMSLKKRVYKLHRNEAEALKKILARPMSPKKLPGGFELRKLS